MKRTALVEQAPDVANGSAGHPRRRRGSRHHCPPATAARVRLAGEREEFTGRVVDLSFGGVGLELFRAVEPGAELALVLPGVGGNLSLVLSARVVHLVPLPRSRWRVGCRFPEAVRGTFLDSIPRA